MAEWFEQCVALNVDFYLFDPSSLCNHGIRLQEQIENLITHWRAALRWLRAPLECTRSDAGL
jgi:hypothetical protein